MLWMARFNGKYLQRIPSMEAPLSFQISKYYSEQTSPLLFQIKVVSFLAFVCTLVLLIFPRQCSNWVYFNTIKPMEGAGRTKHHFYVEIHTWWHDFAGQVCQCHWWCHDNHCKQFCWIHNCAAQLPKAIHSRYISYSGKDYNACSTNFRWQE